MNQLTRLEKAALFTTGAAAAFKALLWSLGATVDSSDSYIAGLRVAFAALSFVAFDLVIGAVVMRGWSRSGAVALAVAALVSAVIALDVATKSHWPILHAAPALTLAAFGVHLMLDRRIDLAQIAASAAEAARLEERAARAAIEAALTEERAARTAAEHAARAAQSASATAAVQVNVAAPAALPRTVVQFIAARAAELSDYSQAQLAAELGTSADTVRRALEKAASSAAEQEA
jgi:hypothetical protein